MNTKLPGVGTQCNAEKIYRKDNGEPHKAKPYNAIENFAKADRVDKKCKKTDAAEGQDDSREFEFCESFLRDLLRFDSGIHLLCLCQMA